MIPTLVRFEIRALARDRSSWLLAGLLAIVVALGAVNGLRWVRFQQEALAHAQTDAADKLAAARSTGTAILNGDQAEPRGWWNNPADVRGFALYKLAAYAEKPPGTAAALTVGQSDLLPYYFRLNAGPKAGFASSYEQENPRRLLLGRFDLAFVAIFLGPLFLIAAVHSAIAAEKEKGLLPLLAAQPTSLPALASIKLLLRAVLLGSAGLAALGLSLALGGFDFQAPGAMSGLARWLLIAGCYGLFWLALAALVISRGWSSAANAFALAGAWVVLVVILPWGLNLLVNLRHPLPSRADYILARRDASDDAFARRADLLTRYLHDHPEFAPEGTKAEQMHYTALDIATTQEVEGRLQEVETRFEDQLRRQQAIVDRWQVVSPAVLAQQAFNDLAGAGWTRHRAFLAQVGEYATELRTYFYPRILSGNFKFSEFDAWPRYAWREPPAAQIAGAAALLVGLAAVFAFGALRAFRRYPVST